MTDEDRKAIIEIVAAAEQRNKAAMAASEGRIVQSVAAAVQAEIKASEARTNARIEETETKLLTEFHRWASPNEALGHTAPPSAR